MSEPKKSILDEQALGRLLEAAFVIQEHGAEFRKQSRAGESNGDESNQQRPASENSASPAQASNPTPVSQQSSEAAPLSPDAYTLTLGRIVETQQILARGLELENAMALVAQRAAQVTKASGSAIGILESKPDGKVLQYRAVSGLFTLTRRSEVPMEKALCFNCLRSGEVMRGADVNSGLLLDAEECKRRGIGSLIAVPIYRDSGIAGALELYFPSPNGFTEQDVHSSQLMAGLVTEALARDAEVSSRKSLAAERATMLEALEKLRPNLAALMASPALKESLSTSAPAEPTTPETPAITAVAAIPTAPVAIIPAADSSAAAIPGKAAAPAFLCRKCGHELVGEEMFCCQCGSPRSSGYRPPTIQSKLASIWHKQQALKQGAAPDRANGSIRAVEQKNYHGVPTEIEPWEAVLSELSDPFAESQPEATRELEPERKLTVTPESPEQMRQEAIEISAAARKFSAELDSPAIQPAIGHLPTSHSPIHRLLDEEASSAPIDEESAAPDLEGTLPLEAEPEADQKTEYSEEERTAVDTATDSALETADPLTWSSAAKAKEAFERLAASRSQNSFVRFWIRHRGDVYFAVAIVLLAAVVRWSITSQHSFGVNSNASAARINHRRPAPDADLSTFDKLLIGLGLADPPDPPEDKGNPNTEVWVDLRSAMYYCPGADLYGKTPQGKYTTQRDAQLGQFEPAYHKACN